MEFRNQRLTSRQIFCTDHHIYIQFSTTAAFGLRIYDYAGNLVIEKTYDATGETNVSKSNYQAFFELNGKFYYAVSNWGSYTGLGYYRIEGNYTGIIPIKVSLTYDFNGAQDSVTRSVIAGKTVDAPATPEYNFTNKYGQTYNFVLEDWYNGETVWDFENDVVTVDTTLKAKWRLPDSFYEVDANAATRVAGTTIRAMSFNILADDWNNKPPVDATRISQVVNTVTRYLPDVVGLQECDDEWYAALNTNLTGYKFVNYATASQNQLNNKTNYSPIMYNTSVLEVVEWAQERLTTYDNAKCRIVTTAVFKIKATNKQFIFMSTHWNVSDSGRVAQASETATIIKKWEKKYPSTPIAISGDFNANESEESITTFLSESGFLDTKETAETRGLVCRTIHRGNGMTNGGKDLNNPEHWYRGRISFTAEQVVATECIDHIFTSTSVKTLFYDTPLDDDSLNSSDHLPIYCDLQF